jgi:hypothetical protein
MSLISLIEAEGVRYGREDSFKMSTGTLQTTRFLLGVPTQQIAPDRILLWCDVLGMPNRLKTAFAGHLAGANMVGFGLEENRGRGFYKLYLEFWEQVRHRVRRTRQTDPLLLHIGFKWRAEGDATDGRITRYMCFPLLPTHDILNRIGQVYANAVTRTGPEMVMGIVRRAAAAHPETLFLYTEATEEGNARTAFDVNLYKSDLTMGDIESYLLGLRQHYGLPESQFLPLIGRIGPNLLGHVSGSLDQAGNDATTLYYETRSLDL